MTDSGAGDQQSEARALADEVFADVGRRSSSTVEVASATNLPGGLDNLLVRAHLGVRRAGWPDEVVVRVLPGDDREDDAAREVLVHARCSAAGLPVPDVLANGVVAAGPYLVMPFVDAPQALSLLNQPWHARRVGRLLGDLHNRIHFTEIDVHGLAVKSVDFWLEALDAVRDTAPREWQTQVTWLQKHRDRAGTNPLSLCHFDFHFMNVLVANDGGTTVLDWDLAGLGDPVADCAFALEILDLMPAAFPNRASRLLTRLILWRVARGYRDAVSTPLPRESFTYWRALYCTFASGWALGLPIAGVRSKAEVIDALSDPVVALATARFRKHTRR